MVAFAWRALLNRLPTKVNVAWRNVISPDQSILCGLCDRREKSSLHLFLHCDLASSVWLLLMSWLDDFFLTPPNLFVHWECWGGWERNKIIKKGRWLIWLSTLWVLWKVRNDKIFNGRSYVVGYCLGGGSWVGRIFRFVFFISGVGTRYCVSAG